MTSLHQLAAAARCINDDDWGSERQIAAENLFFDRVHELLRTDQFEQLESYCLEATTEEMIVKALELIGV
jgi:hypothetical protein